MFCVDLFIVTARIIAKDGHEDELGTILEQSVQECVGQEGLLHYSLHRNKENPAMYLVYEQFTSKASFRLHMDTDAVRSARDRIAGIIVAEPKIEFWSITGTIGDLKCR